MKKTKLPIVPLLKDMVQESGKKLEVPEIRVWCHPKNGGDDFWHTFADFKSALSFIKRNTKSKKFYVEDAPLIAFKGYEINIFGIK